MDCLSWQKQPNLFFSLSHSVPVAIADDTAEAPPATLLKREYPHQAPCNAWPWLFPLEFRIKYRAFAKPQAYWDCVWYHGSWTSLTISIWLQECRFFSDQWSWPSLLSQKKKKKKRRLFIEQMNSSQFMVIAFQSCHVALILVIIYTFISWQHVVFFTACN